MTDPSGIAVAIPAHDEEATIDRSIASVLRAARGPLPVVVVVAADACTDRTVDIVRTRAQRAPGNAELHCVELHALSAGAARQAACVVATDRLRRLVGAGSRHWIATTDADSTVPIDWLAVHRRWARRGADAVTGLVRVDPCSALAPPVRRQVDRELAAAHLGHRHVYGANLGVSATWWAVVGGFPAVATGEDERFVRRLRSAGARVIPVTDAVVVTSGRLITRAPRGFGARLAHLTTDSAIGTSTSTAPAAIGSPPPRFVGRGSG